MLGTRDAKCGDKLGVSRVEGLWQLPSGARVDQLFCVSVVSDYRSAYSALRAVGETDRYAHWEAISQAATTHLAWVDDAEAIVSCGLLFAQHVEA